MAKTDMHIRPIGGRVLVLPEKMEEKTKSGIFLPESSSKEKPQQGKVIALGTGKIADDGKAVSFNVKIGDIVIFKKYAGDKIEVDGEEYLILDEESDIVAVLN